MPFRERLALLARRAGAALYDGLLLLALWLVATAAVLALRGGEAVPPGTVWFELWLLGVAFAFHGWFWVHGGQTLGLRAWRLRVVRAGGAPLGWGDAARRFAAALLALAPAGLGWLWMLADGEGRAWHDRLSGTRVVRARD